MNDLFSSVNFGRRVITDVHLTYGGENVHVLTESKQLGVPASSKEK